MVNIGHEAGSFFQTDAELQKQKEKQAKYNYTLGDCIKLSSKGLALKVVDEGRLAYVAESGFLTRCINLQTGKTVQMFKGHHGPVTSVALSADGDILWTGSWDKTIKKWDTKTGECLATLEGHTDFVKALVLVGSKLYSSSSDMFIQSWDTTSNTSISVFKKLHTRPIESLAVSEDGRYLYSASTDRTIRKWNLETEQCEKVFEGHDTSIYCVRVWDDEMWTASADKTVRRWNTETGAVDMVLTHPERVKSVVLIGPYVVTGASDDNIRIWDIASGDLKCTIKGHFDEVGGLEAHGTMIYSVSLDCSLRRWSITASALEEYMKNDKDEIPQPATEPASGPQLTQEEEDELAELMADD